MAQFSEMMNLFLMYTVALGYSAMLITHFYGEVVHDMIGRRKEKWQLAHEFMLLMFREVEESAGKKLTLANVYQKCQLNSLIEEARSNMEYHFPKCMECTEEDSDKSSKRVEWNGKFNHHGRACEVFNSGGKHAAWQLHPDGTCKFNHVCNKWVSNKGPNGRCLDPGHTRDKCTNPDKCDQPVE